MLKVRKIYLIGVNNIEMGWKIEKLTLWAYAKHSGNYYSPFQVDLYFIMLISTVNCSVTISISLGLQTNIFW